jgi:hypothetical protein
MSQTYMIIQGFENAAACQGEMKRGVKAVKPKPAPRKQGSAQAGPLTPEELKLSLELDREWFDTHLRSIQVDERLLCLPDTIDPRRPQP